MKTFQMNLPGYDSSRDDTDELVRWINAPTKRAAEVFAKSIGAENVEQIRGIEEEEVDHVLDGRGWVIRSMDPNRQWENDFEERTLNSKKRKTEMKNHNPVGYSLEHIDKKIPFGKIPIGRAFHKGDGLCMKTEGSYNNKTNAVTFGCDAGLLLYINDDTLVIPVNASISATTVV